MTRKPPARNQRNSSRRQRKHQHLLDVKVRSRAASRHRTRAVLACISIVLLVATAAGGIVYGGREALRRFFWQNPDYNLAEISFHSDGPLTRDQALEASDLREGVNIFTVNLSAARKGLMALPQVERADLERILPNKISIDVAERKPVAWVTGKEDADPSADPGAYLIDHNGILMRMKTQVRDYYHLPVICGLAVENYEEGDTVDLPEVRAALQLIHLVGENPARYQVRSIDVSKGYCLVVTDERHAAITFPLDNLEVELNRLGLLYASVDADKREIQTVNLLVQRNVPVTFVPPPDTSGTDDDSTPDASPAAGPSPSPDAKKAPTGAAAKKAQFLASAGHKTVKRATAVRKSYPSSTPSSLLHRFDDYQDYQTRRATPASTSQNQ
jgi:cell division protein FtsQ